MANAAFAPSAAATITICTSCVKHRPQRTGPGCSPDPACPSRSCPGCSECIPAPSPDRRPGLARREEHRIALHRFAVLEHHAVHPARLRLRAARSSPSLHGDAVLRQTLTIGAGKTCGPIRKQHHDRPTTSSVRARARLFRVNGDALVPVFPAIAVGTMMHAPAVELFHVRNRRQIVRARRSRSANSAPGTHRRLQA